MGERRPQGRARSQKSGTDGHGPIAGGDRAGDAGAVWLAMSGDVTGSTVEGVFASYEGARRWLEAERERQIAEAREQWEYERERWTPGSEWLAELKRKHPRTAWDEHAAEKVAEPFAGMTEIEDNAFSDGNGGIHGSWNIARMEVKP